MDEARSNRAWTLLGAAALALTVGIMASRAAKTPVIGDEFRDAVASPVAPAALGGARVVQPNAGWFASPAGRRAEAEAKLIASRPPSSRSARARAAKLRRDAQRERALAVSAQ